MLSQVRLPLKLFTEYIKWKCLFIDISFHFSGCDFNSAFFRKGKARPFSIMSQNEKFIDTFQRLSLISENDLQSLFPTIEEFVCRLYGFPKINIINEARTKTFLKMYKIVNSDEVLKLPRKNFDGSALPPCKAELQQHFRRTYYIANIWANAHRQVPTDLDPLNYGWEQINNKYCFKWFMGEQVPTLLEDITLISEEDTSDICELIRDIRDSRSQYSQCNIFEWISKFAS